jgi:hypothetical protein
MDRQTLIAGGFVPTNYEGQEGEFLSKRQPVETLAYMADHAIEGMMATTEVLPDGRIQLSVDNGEGYLEGPHPAGSEEGIALLKDALGLLPREGRHA